MSTSTSTKNASKQLSASEKQPGFFKRIVQKLDDSLKKKSEKTSKQSSCCGGNSRKGKGGKCC